MAYIGKQPVVGNFQKCDAISVVNGQAAYTLNVGGAAVTPENANHMLVSLNGVLQAPGDSFTVSGSTLTFASNLATGDVIDFVIILGDVLDLGAPSDGTVTTAKLASDAVTEAKIADDAVESEHLNNNIISGQTALGATPADTDELLVSDAGTLKRVDFSYLKGGGMFEFISSTDVTSAVAQVDFTSLSSTYSDFKLVIQNLHIGTDNQHPELRFFDTAGNIKTSNYNWVYHGHDTGAKETYSASSGEIRLSAQIGNASHEHANFEITVYDVHETGQATATEGWKMASAEVVYSNAAGEFARVQSGGMWKDNEGGDYSITGLRFLISSGNIESGRFSLYGRKHS